MPKIFISYSTVDRPIVKRFVEALSERGWSVFWDSDIQPGENWHQKTATELEAADCTIVLWTKNSVRSFWVIEEAMYSRQRGVLLPVIFENVSPPPGFCLYSVLTYWLGAMTRMTQAFDGSAMQSWSAQAPH